METTKVIQWTQNGGHWGYVIFTRTTLKFGHGFGSSSPYFSYAVEFTVLSGDWSKKKSKLTQVMVICLPK